MRLNRHQEKAVQQTNHSVVVACPGSGKTRVLVEKASHLRQGALGADIIIVTFTRQAADELRRRLTQKMASLSRLRVATFHSLRLEVCPMRVLCIQVSDIEYLYQRSTPDLDASWFNLDWQSGTFLPGRPGRRRHHDDALRGRTPRDL